MRTAPVIQTPIAALLVGCSSAGVAAGSNKLPGQDPKLQAQKQSRKMELAKQADDKRKADEARKHAEIERLAKEAEQDRQQEAMHKAE